MKQQQAKEVVDYLLEAAYELDEARAAASTLAEQDKDAASLEEFIVKLNTELLQAVYERFPDMIPFGEFPAISSTLRWEDVSLPASVSEADIDQIIFSVLKPRWQKMAMVVILATEKGQEFELPVTGKMFAARVLALAEAERLEGQGDLRKWRHSEVRLKGAAAPRVISAN